MTTRAAHNASERRRLARRKAEARGLRAPDGAAIRDGTEPEGPSPTPSASRAGRDLTPEILRWGVVRRAELALARQAASSSTERPAISSTEDDDRHHRATELADEPSKRRRAGLGPEARLRRESLNRGSEALRAVLRVPCPTHEAPPLVGCWPLGDGVAVCPVRITRAGFVANTATRSHRREDPPRRWAS